MVTKVKKPITKKHVLEAAQVWREQPGRGGFRLSTKYDIIIGTRAYPPKAIISIANECAGNGKLTPQDFKGAGNGKWHQMLRDLGFDINAKDEQIESVHSPAGSLRRNFETHVLFKKSLRGFLVTGTAKNDVLNIQQIKKNRTGDWFFAADRVARKGDALFILLPDPHGVGGYPRRLFGGVLSKNPVREANGKVCFFVVKFHALPSIVGEVKQFLGGVLPPQGDRVLTLWDDVAAIATFKPALGMADLEQTAFPEGKRSYKLHVSRERSAKLVKLAKADRMQKAGKLECDVCEIDFAIRYGPKGAGFIEAHHTIPVSTLKKGDETDVSDLALVCSNCHSMLHRMQPRLGIDQLRDLLLTSIKLTKAD